MKRSFISLANIIFPMMLTFSLLMLTAGCSKDEPLPEANMGYRYFPDEAGVWTIYRVDSVNWDGFSGDVDTFQYQIKEVIESVFYDEQNRPTLRIERYKRWSDTADWVIKDVWFANRTPSTAERVEENVRYLKLIFPVDVGDEWNGNLLNVFEEQEYAYLEAHSPLSFGNFRFDSTLTVLQIDESTLISRDYAIERYATGVGMFYRKCIQQNIKLTGVIESGYDYSYTLIDYGRNQ